jgi:ABC-type lipoprotein release transport system permease subunit
MERLLLKTTIFIVALNSLHQGIKTEIETKIFLVFPKIRIYSRQAVKEHLQTDRLIKQLEVKKKREVVGVLVRIFAFLLVCYLFPLSEKAPVH